MNRSTEQFMDAIKGFVNEGKTVTISLKGFSMRPFLEDQRDRALLTKPGNIKVGDPILAKLPNNKFVLHRVINIEDDTITMLGDGNLTPEFCYRKDVIASVVGFYRKGRQTLDRIDGRKWHYYSVVWMALRPVRRYLLYFYRTVWLRFFKPI